MKERNCRPKAFGIPLLRIKSIKKKLYATLNSLALNPLIR